MELIFRDDAYQKSCEATVTSADEGGIRLDRTVFYPTGGGQPGDSGVLRLEDGGEIRIVEARKGADHEDVVHVPEAGAALPAPGTKVSAEIDWEQRYGRMRIHSCMHVLCAIIEGDVTGGQVGDGKGRLDFNLPDTQLDKEAITAELNRIIAEDHPLQSRWITEEELAANPQLVRTMSVKP
ncbi:MAG: alanyl-tRNA editing protein, partial [Proteobacteria bacterium]|nr:alanyl-tRNA editing protein [Pseudomonadota bacterium]